MCCSLVVTHLRTKQTFRCLTDLIERELEFSARIVINWTFLWYGTQVLYCLLYLLSRNGYSFKYSTSLLLLNFNDLMETEVFNVTWLDKKWGTQWQSNSLLMNKHVLLPCKVPSHQKEKKLQHCWNLALVSKYEAPCEERTRYLVAMDLRTEPVNHNDFHLCSIMFVVFSVWKTYATIIIMLGQRSW